MSYFFIFLQRVAGLMLSCSAVSFLRPLFLRSVSRMRSFSQRSMADSREETLQPEEASKERSDVCAVPAAAVVAEAEVAFVLASAYQEAFGATCMADIRANVAHYRDRLKTLAR